MDKLIVFVLLISVMLSIFSFGWYFVSLGKRIHEEEKRAGRDLTHEINPFTGSSYSDDNK